jgi:uncharacterized protein
MNIQHAKLISAMTTYDHGDAMRIQHFMKVHAYAALIGIQEQIPADTLFVLETAAIVHDIGIHVSEQKYGSSNGKYQEMEGPDEARRLLGDLGGYTEEQISRVCYLVGHHHTYTQMDGMDYQILVEADFLVNIYEDQLSEDAIDSVYRKIFRTNTGKMLLKEMYQHHRNL